MTAPGPRSGAARGNPAAPAHSSRDTTRRVVPLFRPYRAQVAAVVGLIVVTSTIGIINPLLIQAGGKVQWRCTDGDVMADGTIRHRQAQPA